MKKLSFILSIGLLICVVGCSTIPFPQCNDSYAQNSKLMQIASKHGVCIRDVGNGLIIANGLAIGMKAYTVNQAIVEVNKGIELLNSDTLTELAFKQFAMKRLRAFPGLIEVSMIYMPEFNSVGLMDKESKVVIQEYLRDKVLPILNAYVI